MLSIFEYTFSFQYNTLTNIVNLDPQRVCCTGSSETDKSQNSARNNITKIVVSNNMSNDEQHSRAISNGWIEDESALPLRYRTPNVYPVNIPLMIKSRFLIPFIFSVFNMAYWGSALT